MKYFNQTIKFKVKLALNINGMTIDEFQKEIEKLSHLFDEMKQLSIVQKEEEYETDD